MEQKLNLDALDELSLDLRICLLHCCFNQSNYSKIIKNLPAHFCHNQNLKFPDFKLLKKTVEGFPSIGTNIKQLWIHLDEHCRALVDWFIDCPMKRVERLSFLPQLQYNETLDCNHQFVMNRVPKYQEFIDCKEKYGSVICYHGSPTCNWPAIIRHNLQNYSNTKQMSSGALFGAGIYLTSAISLSRGFSKMNNKIWNKSKLGSSIAVVGVFEVALHPEFVRSDKIKNEKKKVPEHYFVVADNKYIEMRGMLVWSESRKQQRNKNVISWWLIGFYLILILSVVAYGTKWDRFQKQAWRYMNDLVR